MLKAHGVQDATLAHHDRSQVHVGQETAKTSSRRVPPFVNRVVDGGLPLLRIPFVVLLASWAILALTRQLPADTIAYWRFEEGSANTAASGADSILDSSGNNLHGTPRGGPVYRTVSNPNSSLGLSFDGVDDGVSFPDSPVLELTESLTLEAFVRVDSFATSGPIVWRGDDRTGRDPFGLQFIGDDASDPDTRRSIQFFIHPEGGGGLRESLYTPPQFPLPLGETFHVAGTLDDATGAWKIFINGNVVAEATTDSRPFGTLDASFRPRISMGNIDQGGNQNVHGIIDEVRISDAALDRGDFLIPEPSTLALAALGLITVLTARRMFANVWRNKNALGRAHGNVLANLTQDASSPPSPSSPNGLSQALTAMPARAAPKSERSVRVARRTWLRADDVQSVKLATHGASHALCFATILCVACVSSSYATAQFVRGTPVNFGPVVNSEANENNPVLSNDGRTLYFHSNRPGGVGNADIWMSTRDSLESDWSPVQNFSAINTSASELRPFVSMDGLTFIYNDGLVDDQPGRIYQLSRADVDDPWGPRSALSAPINDGVSNSSSAFLSADGSTLLFHSDREGGLGMTDLYEATRPSLGGPWTVRNLGSNVNSSAFENNPIMSSDGLTLIFGSDRAGGEGGLDIWMSRRDFVGADWGPATNLGPMVNTAGNENPSQLWEPGNLLLFKSGAPDGAGLPGEGGADMFYVSVVPEPSTLALAALGLVTALAALPKNAKAA